jgi:Flp pilus assembly secretin CpaC
MAAGTKSLQGCDAPSFLFSAPEGTTSYWLSAGGGKHAKISVMLRLSSIFAAGILAALAMPVFLRADDAAIAPPISCANGLIGGINCIPSKRDMKEAKEAFGRGVKLSEHQQLEQAFVQFDQAARLAPRDFQFLSAREEVKAKLVYGHVEAGNALMAQDARLRAANEFRAALELDPDNEFVRERLQEATFEARTLQPATLSPLDERLAASQEIHLEPDQGQARFHFTGTVHSLFEQLAAAYKIKLQFDDTVQERQVRFNVDSVDFFTALQLASQVTKTMWAPLDAHQMLIAADTKANHNQYDRMSLRTFILPPHATPQEATEMVNVMRNMFDLRFITSGLTNDTVEVRGPAPALDACAKMLAQLNNQRPQVMLDVRVFQIDHQLTRNIGLHVPNTFNLFNIPAIALAGLAGQNIQQLINQLISSGGINQVGSSALSGLLAQLGGQGSNSIFSQPLATFGGGLTFMGLSLDQLSAALSVNESWARSLENLSMRAAQGTDATFHLGEKFPILNASYAPVFNSPQISQVLGNQSYVPPFPSVSYEDLGLNMKAKPTVHGDGTVSLHVELQVRSLTGQSANGVPVISNREYQGTINLQEGEPAFIAGEISSTDTLSMSGIPGFGFLPVLNQAMVNNTKQQDNDELLISITPHVVANFQRGTPEIWLPRQLADR